MSEIINGSIVRINYYNKDNGYTVVVFLLNYKDEKTLLQKNKIIGNTISVVGNFERQPIEDEEYTITGKYEKNKNYGLQFRIESYERKEIASESGIISYLSSDLFNGVGLKSAKMVVETLGIDAINTIKNDPNALQKVNIPEKQKMIIREGIINDQTNQETTLFFLDNGITMDMTHKIIATFGYDVVEQVKENPYILMEKIEHFGFKKNDVFALKLGIKKNATVRLKAVICFVLQELIYNSGNSYIDKTILYQRVTTYLNEEIEHNDFNNILNILRVDKKIYIDDNINNNTVNIFDYILYLQEIELAEEIVKLLKGERNEDKALRTYDEKLINSAFSKVKKESNLIYSEEQETAIRSAFTEPIVIVTGGPGTGKTTIVHSIIKLYLELNNNSQSLATEIALLAPTGRAAKRLKETTMMDAKTIHRFLGYTGFNKYTYNKYNRTSARLIIVDEASMMDLTLAHHLLTSMHEDARLIIVGDVDQLPAVGPGQVLKDLITSKEIKTICLNKIHRQAEGSSIIKLAHNVNEGIVPEDIFEKKEDRTFIQTDNEHISSLLIDIVRRIIDKGKDIKKDIQILIPIYKGIVGITEINNQIQNLVNPISEKIELKHMGHSFRPNDKVIQLINRADKNIMNGDIGVITNIIYKDSKPYGLSVLYDIGMIDYTMDELDDISLAYAVSVHKAQGSEFEIVILPISSLHFTMLKRKLIYTAITRAKKTLILIGDIKIFQSGIINIEKNRNTILKDKIIDYLHKGMNDVLPDDPDLIIDDEESAFNTIGERDAGKLKISDFED